ncbi:MAG: hypothetical protein ACPGJS_12615 [Flammeovirgaceae bacterium]
MENTSLYYTESGALGSTGPLLLGGMAFLGSLVLGAIYAYATFYIPLIYLNFLLTIGYGTAMGFLMGKAALWGKVRNQQAVRVFSLAAGILSVYFSWVFWIYAASEQEVLTFSILNIIRTMNLIAEEGLWSIFDLTPTGIALYAIWLIEAGIIFVGTYRRGSRNAVSLPYCENCDQWIEQEVLTSQLAPIQDLSLFVQNLESQSLEALMTLEKVGHNAHRRTKVDLSACKSCKKEHYLSISQIDTEFNDEGKPEEKEIPLLKNLIIDKTAYETLKEWNKV